MLMTTKVLSGCRHCHRDHHFRVRSALLGCPRLLDPPPPPDSAPWLPRPPIVPSPNDTSLYRRRECASSHQVHIHSKGGYRPAPPPAPLLENGGRRIFLPTHAFSYRKKNFAINWKQIVMYLPKMILANRNLFKLFSAGAQSGLRTAAGRTGRPRRRIPASGRATRTRKNVFRCRPTGSGPFPAARPPKSGPLGFQGAPGAPARPRPAARTASPPLHLLFFIFIFCAILFL